MVGIGIFFLVLIIFFVLSMFLRIRFEVEYRRKGPDDNLTVEMAAFNGLFRYQTKVPVMELDRYFLEPVLKMETGTQWVATHPVEDKGLTVKIPVITDVLANLPAYMQQGIRRMQRYQRIFKKFLRYVRCHQFAWTTEVGLGDPADTGLAAGMLWGLKGYFFSAFRSRVGAMLHSPRLAVKPCFECTCFRLDFHCIFDVRIGHIIIAGLNFVKLSLKT